LVTASTLADPYTVVSSAIGTLKGPLHGGASEAVIKMFRAIQAVSNVAPFIEARLKADQPIMGLGHREYKVKDPRAIILQSLAQQLFDPADPTSLYPIAQEVERVGETKLAHKGVYANVDFYAGIVYQKMGIESDFFTPMFAMSRVVGWLAHWIEQVSDNHIFRPTALYDGPHDLPYTPPADRITT
jgi:citrate synthase